LIAIGTLQKNALEEVAPAIPPSYNFRLISLLTITNGSLIILVAFIGFLAVLHNNHPFLNIWSSFKSPSASSSSWKYKIQATCHRRLTLLSTMSFAKVETASAPIFYKAL
jgi:hypothetical protein